ncbi:MULTISPECIES: hypothetical protein [unclassified Colwellia]|jgi:hypothetical protein|uniref:hypothetical protein n=1 Tax=unclassified Colwellia TaxID=196834 RepID=UPI0015F54288|nr:MULTISPECIES: hypothetical protein [unclassified Colwellia]MBA6380185.1 hypothetical protein [Colwellia sp. BRX10-7]MBA6387509.1 hypothetical protein [Colwellia sp. BRX10-2]MBA6402484.1 hypothetical protein [Colwellia sp. BRX10-5]MBA6406731.1 hypothetical protein [Colwellia sp. BRX10-1]
MKPELIISISSIVIAVSAVAINIWQAAITRKHHKLSVCPHLTVDYDSRPSSDISFILNSTGLGPSKLKKYKWVINGKDIPIRTTQDHTLLVESLGLADHDIEFYAPSTGRFIEQGFNSTLLTFSDTSNSSKHGIIKAQIAKNIIEVVFEYESIYGEIFVERHNPNTA